MFSKKKSWSAVRKAKTIRSRPIVDQQTGSFRGKKEDDRQKIQNRIYKKA